MAAQLKEREVSSPEVPVVEARAPEAAESDDRLDRLRARQAEHPFWSNKLFRACEAGVLTRDDFRLIFSQYYHYSRNFTRYLAAFLANLDDDLWRTRVVENLWEESGGLEADRRHSEIYRRFLANSLGVDVASIETTDAARHFVSEVLRFCREASAPAGAAFLSLGTEGIVARMYQIFMRGLTASGIPEAELEFFRIHVECDDEHAETLERILLSFADQPGWYATSLDALDAALTLRGHFFDALFDLVRAARVERLLARVQARESLTGHALGAGALVHRAGDAAVTLYENHVERLNIRFTVEQLPFASEVLDARVVRVPPGRRNERHKHAHESVFFVMSGRCRVFVDDETVEASAGDTVFVPRWSLHQTENTGETELVMLATTDYGLTGRAYVGDYLKTARPFLDRQAR